MPDMVNNQPAPDNAGSIEKGMSGDYAFSIRAVLSEAWQKTNGAKWPVHLGFLYYFLIVLALIIVTMVASMALMTAPVDPLAEPTAPIIMQLILQLGINLIALPMMMGVVMMGIKRSVDAPISANLVFTYFQKMFSLLLAMIMIYIMVIIGLLLLVLPGIYLMVAYYMALPLIVEKGLSPWQAMEVSRKTISHRWFRMLGFFIVASILITISMIPLGIGLIWTLPMFIIAYGILYRNMFGVEATTLAS
ncbi:hypothetical protein MNBD_GAMMA23-742 [hydrothermal vent metagenome]|uniref:Integral membrane protein n=1 Tax=hydrothermal vent metagenome TaxID=652676 RepID=A0A3B1A6J2_9ZZZZ